jgi:SRSO17 transposase
LLPRDRNKTLTGLAGAEPIVGAQHREVQRLQWFLSESTWDHQQVNDQRVRLLCQSATAPNDRGALVIDDTGDRKDGTATAHVARQYLGSVGKIDKASSRSPAYGPTSAATGRSMRCPTRQRFGCPAGSATLGSTPSHSWPWS